MSLDELESLATIVGVPVAAFALVAGAFQLWQQKVLSQQDRMVQVYLDCTKTFATLHERHAELLANEYPSESTRARMDRNFIAYWDLLASEYESALVNLLPREVFVRWFKLAHDRLHGKQDEEARMERESWTGLGAPFAGVVSPNFAAIVDYSLSQPDFNVVAGVIRQSWRVNRPRALFKPLQ
jgi:hypothetical protein